MKKLISILTLGILFSLISCSNLLQDTNNSSSQDIKSDDGKTYIVISKTTIRQSNGNIRAASTNLAPTKDDLKIENFSDFEISGKLNSGTEKKLAKANSYEELVNKKIPVEEGSWEFKLTAKLNDIPFSATSTKNIKAGSVNKISFILKSDIHTGTLDFTVSWKNTEEENQSEANKIVATLKDAAETHIIAEKTLQASDITDKSAQITFDKNSDGQELSSGTYYLSLDFYNEGTIKPLNTTEYYVNIADGLATRAELKVSLNETFTIQYEDNGGQLSGGSIKTLKFSQRSEKIDLPQMEKPGYFWGGWYDNEELTGQPIESITPGSAQTQSNLKFYAKWNEPVLYVSGTGDDPTGDGTEEHPFESIDKACEKIIETGDSEMEWIIYIMGDVTGPHSGTSKAGSRGTDPSKAGDTDFGRTELSADITSDYAKSILLIGKSGLDANDIPQDMLNRGLVQGTSTTTSPTGNVLAVATTVPVTIKNLKITGGNTASSSSTNTTNDPYYRSGGGLYVAEGANVTLDDGVLITKNKAYNGGAVYNAGTLTMVGSATIGDSSVTTYPQKGITATADLSTGKYPASNEYKYGGGIYNIGTLYLGSSGTSGKELTGGIYNSFGDYAYGGGLYNSGNGTIVMSSGKINYNDGQSHAGGVYLDSGTFTMTGGEIFFNSTAGKGGGVYVNYNAVFYFGGGTISGNNANTSGGGVYIDGGSNGTGKMFMYGNAVIGNSSATSPAPEIISGETADEKIAMSDGCNMAPYGAGIYILGELYIGYSSQDVTAPLTGGIFYNSAKVSSASNGGALYIGSSGYPKVFMNSGTINYNYAREGEGIYLYSTKFTMSSLTVGSDTYIPEIPQNIRLAGTSYYINIDSLLDSAANGAYSIVPSKNSSGDSATSYSSNAQILKLTDAAKAQNITIDKVKDKFAIETFINPRTGIVSNWIIDSNGKLAQKAETFNVSSSGTYTSISDAVAQMNDDTKDYIISISGEITGTQTIPETVQANSITIKGASSSGTTSVPGNGINANLADGVEGTALTINTNIPVTLNNIVVKGGHGTEKDGVIIGGGLLLGQNAHVCLDNNTRILQNITYDKGDGTPGYGAGVYISDGAKLYENSDCHITENTATSRGAGVYIADGGYLQTMAESGSYVTLNTFDTSFRDGDGNAIVPCGGAVYIEDNATLEMFGAWFRDNCQDVDNCLGSGIYLSANGNLKASGHTEVVVPNDIYLQDGAQIEIAAAISPTNPSQYTTPNITARLTPEIYAEGKTLLKSTTGLSANTFTNALQKFEILPQDISGQKQYWTLNTSGQLQKNAGTGISVTIPGNTQNDIEVTISNGDGSPIEGNTHFTGGSTLVFTVTDQTDFSNCIWKIDGEEQTTPNVHILSVNTSNWAPGTYVVYLEAQDTNGKYYSYTAQIKVGE